jgi:hypothetical protein
VVRHSQRGNDLNQEVRVARSFRRLSLAALIVAIPVAGLLTLYLAGRPGAGPVRAASLADTVQKGPQPGTYGWDAKNLTAFTWLTPPSPITFIQIVAVVGDTIEMITNNGQWTFDIDTGTWARMSMTFGRGQRRCAWPMRRDRDGGWP